MDGAKLTILTSFSSICRTRQELEDVFGDGGEYAAALSADTRGVRGRSGKAKIEDVSIDAFTLNISLDWCL